MSYSILYGIEVHHSNQYHNVLGMFSKDDEGFLSLDHSQDNNRLQTNGCVAASYRSCTSSGALCQHAYTHVFHIYYNHDFQVVLDGACGFHMDLAFPVQWLYTRLL